MKISNKSFFICFLMVTIILSGCTSNVGLKKKSSSIFVPVGVDTLVAAEADSLSDQLFVSLEKEQKAAKLKRKGIKNISKSDSIWKYLSMSRDSSSQRISKEDSLAAIKSYNQGALKVKQALMLQKSLKNEADAMAEVTNLLQQAKVFFEKSIVLNPFDLETKSWLARVYELLAQRFLIKKDYQKAIEILEKLVRIEKGEHVLFARLGENYYHLKNWEKAYYNFHQAGQLLKNMSFDAPLDTNALFLYTYYQGDTQAKMYNADSALFYLKIAISLSETDDQKEKIASYIAWINWDNGNIAASEEKDKILELETNKEFDEAAKRYKKLVPKLKTNSARNEIKWRLSLIEFEVLKRQKEGITLLQEVIKSINRNQANEDTLKNRYFESYGAMLHNMGVDYLKKNRKIAFSYYLQASKINWSGKAKSFLELAKLSKNNPDKVIEYCNEALKLKDQLDKSELFKIYQLLTYAYKRNNKPQLARQAFELGKKLQKELR